MRVRVVAMSVVLVLLAWSPGAAQSTQSFHELGLRLNLDDRIRIEDQSGVETSGRLTGLTAEDLTIRTDAEERRFTIATVHRITVRRHVRRAAVLIGAASGALFGTIAGCVSRDREHCADGWLLAGAVGAVGGVALSGLAARTTTVYASATDTAAPRGSVRSPGGFDALALRVNLGDSIRVEDRSGARSTGRLTHLTGDEMIVDTDDGQRRFTSTGVRTVAVRGYALGRSALIGAGALVVIVVASPSCRSNDDCQPIAAAPLGAGLGLAIGALIPRMTTVFRTSGPQASFSPEFSRGRLGVRASLRW